MAKKASNKLSLAGLLLTVGSGVLTVLSFVGMAFKFVITKVKTPLKTITSTQNLKETMNMLKDVTKAETDGYIALNAARVFMIIALVLMVVALVLAVVSLLVKNKWINLATLVVGAVAVVCFVLFLILMAVGLGQVAEASSVAKLSEVTSVPYVGVYVVALCGAFSSALAAVKSRF